MARKRKELERPPEELRKDQSIVKTTPRIDSRIASEIRNLEKATPLSYIFCKKRKQVCNQLVPSKSKGDGTESATCSSEKVTPNIPDDLMSEILLRLPADVLYNAMRFVCKSWHNIIHDRGFINLNTHKSVCTGLLATVYGTTGPCTVYFLELGHGEGENQGKRREQKIFEMGGGGIIIDSCDGLVLIREFELGKEQYRILNPLTRQQVIHALPESPNFTDVTISGGIERARLSGKYKVVQAYGTPCSPFHYDISVLTLGVDSTWRCIKKEQIIDYYWDSTLSIEGFVYWLGYEIVWVFDVEDEKIHRVRLPTPHTVDLKRFHMQFIKSESFLILVFHNTATFDFWALVSPKTGEWKNLYQLKLNGKKRRHSIHRLINPSSKKSCLYEFRPEVILNDDIVVFSAYEGSVYIGYDVKTGAFFRCGGKNHRGVKVVHRQTLVPLD